MAGSQKPRMAGNVQRSGEPWCVRAGAVAGDPTAWPIDERTPYDELAELACMSALAAWLRRWVPVAVHGAVLAGAKPEAVADALGNSLRVASERWQEWSSDSVRSSSTGNSGSQ